MLRKVNRSDIQGVSKKRSSYGKLGSMVSFVNKAKMSYGFERLVSHEFNVHPRNGEHLDKQTHLNYVG